MVLMEVGEHDPLHVNSPQPQRAQRVVDQPGAVRPAGVDQRHPVGFDPQVAVEQVRLAAGNAQSIERGRHLE
jgi:hypothetical protein